MIIIRREITLLT